MCIVDTFQIRRRLAELLSIMMKDTTIITHNLTLEEYQQTKRLPHLNFKHTFIQKLLIDNIFTSLYTIFNS